MHKDLASNGMLIELVTELRKEGIDVPFLLHQTEK